MKKGPLISIITPTYNHENFIGRCIESVLAQTYPHWEQIIIDDGSTDGTSKVVSQYQDGRIKYIRQNNIGVWRLNETYNRALQCSQGEFVTILEGDDFWPRYKLERQFAAFDRREVVLSWGKAASIDSNGKIIAINPKNLKWFNGRSKGELLNKLLINNFIPACTVMCRKDVLLSCGGFKQPKNMPCVDYPTWLELILYGEFSPVDELLGYWRQHEKQVTRTMTTAFCEVHKYAIDFFNQIPQDLKKSIKINYNDLVMNYQYDMASIFFYSGRKALTEYKWDTANKHFKEAIDKGSLSTKIKAIVGLICSHCRIDLEWAATILNKDHV